MNDKPIKLNTQISEEAAEWLVEFRTGDIDASGRRAFDAWVRSSPEHLRAYVEIAAIWNEGGGLDAHRGLNIDTLTQRVRARGNVLPFETFSVQMHPHEEVPRSSMSAASKESAAALFSGQSSRNDAITNPVIRALSQPSAFGSKPARTVFSRRVVIAASSVILSVAVLCSVWIQFFHVPVYTTAVGEQRKIRLSDGSTVELNSRSTLRVRFSKGERDVDLLEGQALFHVAKDHARPFIVASDGARARAVGTQFDVNRKTEGTVVTVLEGRVAVTSASDSDSFTDGSPTSTMPSRIDFDMSATASNTAFLSAGEQVTLTPRVTPKPIRTNVSAATAWTQHRLVLDSASLTEVAEDFNRYSTRKLIVEESASHDLRLSGVFSTDPDFLIRYLRDRPDITVLEIGSEIHISHHD